MNSLVFAAFAAFFSFQTAQAVKSCFFCADTKEQCGKNMQAFQPKRMTCANFLVSNIPMKKFFRNPHILAADPNVFYTVGLPEKNVKTLCMFIEYKFRDAIGYWNRSEENYFKFNKYEDKNTYVVQSCMYRRIAGFKNACHFYESTLFVKYNFQYIKCYLCKRHDCNSILNLVAPNLILLVFAEAVLIHL